MLYFDPTLFSSVNFARTLVWKGFSDKLLVSILVFVFLRLQFYFVNYVIVSCELPYYNSFGQRMLLKN